MVGSRGLIREPYATSGSNHGAGVTLPLFRSRRLDLDRIRSITPILETATPEESQFRSALCPSSVARPADIDRGYWKPNAEHHTRKGNAKRRHSSLPRERFEIISREFRVVNMGKNRPLAEPGL